MIRLFLANQEVELDESVSFAITKQFEDVTSPADIKNDYSKTVNIPFTQSNNQLFGYLFNVDRLIVESSGSLKGIYFNPYKKIDFRLQWCDSVLLQGYAKVLNIIKEGNNRGYYSISLNGELGKVFQEMKKITFDMSTDDPRYLINGSKYVSENISKDLIHSLWTTEPHFEDLSLLEKTDTNYKVNDIIGFAPNNSFNEDFDYKTFQVNKTTSKKFSEELNSKAKSHGNNSSTYETITGISADTVIGNGLLPRSIGEFRSYLQLPYIYFNKLFKIILNKTKELTGYDYELDSNWFNASNPYWSKLVYMLKRLDIKNENKTNEDTTDKISLQSCNLRSGDDNVPVPRYPYTYSPSTLSEQWIEFSGLKYIDEIKGSFERGDIDTIIINQEIPIDIILNNPRNAKREEVGTSTDKLVMGPGAHISVVFGVYDENNSLVDWHTTAVCGTSYEANNLGNPEMVYELASIPNSGGRIWSTTVSGKMVFLIDRNTVGSTFTIKMYAKYVIVPTGNDMLSSYIEPVYFLNSIDSKWNNIVVFDNVQIAIPNNTKITYATSDIIKRSNGVFTLNDLWNNEFNPFNEILDYCKMYRIGVFCDDLNKKLIFKPLNKYFGEYKVLDWTDKLDLSKEYNIQPITFENKYILFNYNSADLQLNKDYTEKYGVKFGEYKLTTDYEFNNETKNIYDGIYNSIPSSDIVLSWGQIYDNLNIVYVLPAEILPNNKNKDNKCVDIFGSYFLYNGLADWDTTSGMYSAKISDDTTLQVINNLYFYTQNSEGDKNIISTKTYPLLDIKGSDRNVCLFKTPVDNYTYKSDNYNNTMGIYDNFWKHYLDERYNKQNKIVTCYLRLTPYDVLNFEYNNFIRIENQLYMVNKIHDYQIDENISTKVDLITIQDIEGYTKNDFSYLDVLGVESGDTIELGSNNGTSRVVYVSSPKDVNVTINIESGSVEDCYINDISLLDVSHGYEKITIKSGDKQRLNLYTLTGGSDCKITVTLTNEAGDSISFKVIVIW